MNGLKESVLKIRCTGLIVLYSIFIYVIFTRLQNLIICFE
jgi:hypothetical protein